MSAVDPRDPHAVAGAVRGWASDRFGTEVALVGEASAIGAGFDSFIHLIELRGHGLPDAWRLPLVVRILPTADRAERAQFEAAAQGWAADAGYPTPRVHAVIPPGELLDLPLQVMERAPGVTMLDALKAKPWRAFRIIDDLAGLQLRLHALDTTGWPHPTSAGSLAETRLSLPRRAVQELDDPALTAGLMRAEELVESGACSGGAVVACHGDFHPLNVIVDGAAASVIDWTDAGLGPPEADISRTVLLLHMAAIAAGGRIERAVLTAFGPRGARRYRRTYEAAAPLDVGRLRSWEALHALHGWAQIAMLHAGAFDGASSSAGNERRVPLTLAGWLRSRFESDLA
jgi:aminoglycoside phosphotransferase (APT) family kinase protein